MLNIDPIYSLELCADVAGVHNLKLGMSEDAMR